MPAESAQPHCHLNGFLVDSLYPMMGPGDPPLSQADVEAGRIVGCSHVVCSRCHSEVVQVAHATFKQPFPSVKQLYDAQVAGALESLLEQRPDLPHRAYACRCQYQTAVGALSFDEMWQDQAHPWSCGGHPG